MHGAVNHTSHRYPKPRCWWLWSDKTESDLAIHLKWSPLYIFLNRHATENLFLHQVCATERKHTDREPIYLTIDSVLTVPAEAL